jgi:conjugal transfer pilus assembly protein TraD
MNPPGTRARVPAWQQLLILAVVAFVLIASPPLSATILITAGAMGAILATPFVRARRRRARTATTDADVATVLGTDQDGAPVALTHRQLEAHAVILGASGSGKTTTLLKILADQILSGRGVVAIDMKGSPAFAAALASAANEAGKPFFLWTPDGPSTWNPLAYGNPTQLKDKLIAMERFTEIHYQRAAERYLQNVLQALHRASPERAATLAEVVELMDPARLAGFLHRTPPEFADRVQRYLDEELTPDQVSGIRGMATRLAIVTESQTGEFLGARGDASGAQGLSGPGLDLPAALRGEQVVLFSLNASSYGKLAAQLEALVLRDLITVVGTRTSDPASRHPGMVALDEFSASEDDQVVHLQARCRESGVGFAVASQEPTDFERVSRGLLDQVLGNTAVKIAHRLDVPRSAQLVADLAGTETVWEETHQLEQHPLLGARRSGRSTARQVERYLVHPNVIKSLPTGRAVVITKVPEARVEIVTVTPPERVPVHPPAGQVAPARPPGRSQPAHPPARSQPAHPPARSQPAHPSGRSPEPRGLPAPRRDGPELR